MFPFINCCQIPQLNCEFKRLAVSTECMTVLEKIMLIVVEIFFCTNKCKYMSLNAGTELTICKRKRTCFSVLSFKSRPALKLLEQHECSNTCATKNMSCHLYMHST